MPVTDFECQIARGQIDRYLGGGLLSPTALSGLEEHLGECAACKSLVAERRMALLGKLNGEAPTHAVVSMPKKEAENPLIAALRAKSEEALLEEEPKQAEAPKAKTSPRYAGATEKTAKPVLTKPILLAGLLAVVLVGMNAMSRANNGKGVMGGKAAESFASESLPSAAQKTEPVAASKPVAPKPIEKSVETPAPVAEKPKVPATEVVPDEKPLVETTAVEKPVPKKVATPKRTVAVRPLIVKPRVRNIVRRRAARPRLVVRKRAVRKIARAPRTGVRVYGLDGHPLKP
jgi:anti-sigma factor RsiW